MSIAPAILDHYPALILRMLYHAEGVIEWAEAVA